MIYKEIGTITICLNFKILKQNLWYKPVFVEKTSILVFMVTVLFAMFFITDGPENLLAIVKAELHGCRKQNDDLNHIRVSTKTICLKIEPYTVQILKNFYI